MEDKKNEDQINESNQDLSLNTNTDGVAENAENQPKPAEQAESAQTAPMGTLLNEQKDVSAGTSESTMYSEPKTSEMGNAEFAKQGSSTNYAYQSEPDKGKGKKGGLFVGIAAALVALIVLGIVIVSVTAGGFGHFFKRNFASAKDYYKYVEGKGIDKGSKKFSEVYDVWLSRAKESMSGSYTGQIKVELGDKAKDMFHNTVGLMSGVDIDWLDSLTVDMKTTLEEDAYGIWLNTILNEDDLLSSNIFLTDSEIFWNIPEIGEEYLYLNFEEAFYGPSLSTPAMYQQFYESLPTGEKVESVLKRYGHMTLDIDMDVKKSKETLEVGEISQSVYKLEATTNTAEWNKMLRNMAEKAKEDEDLEEVIKAYYKAYYDMYSSKTEPTFFTLPDADEGYEDFIESLDEFINNEETGSEDEEVVSTVWVDSRGNIVGRKMEITKDGQMSTSEYKFPHKGNKFGFEFLATTEGEETTSISGTGEYKGGKISGEFTFAAESEEAFVFILNELDIKEIEKGNINLSASILPTASIEDAEMLPLDPTAFKINLDIKQEGNKKAELNVEVLYDEENFITLTSNSQKAADEALELPDDKGNMIDAGDEAALEIWVKTVDWDSFVKHIRTTDIPSEWIDEFETLLTFIKE